MDIFYNNVSATLGRVLIKEYLEIFIAMLSISDRNTNFILPIISFDITNQIKRFIIVCSLAPAPAKVSDRKEFYVLVSEFACVACRITNAYVLGEYFPQRS